MNILLGDFNEKFGRERILSNRQLGMIFYIRIVISFRIVNFAASKNLVVKSTIFQHRNINTHTWTFPDGKIHKEIDHTLIDRRS